MSRIMRSKQPAKIITKENVADSLGTKGASKVQPAESKLKTTKGNDKLLNANICTLRSPVLQDRTNLTLEPTKVLLKKGKNGKADTEVTRFETKRTRSSKLKDDEESKNSAIKTVKKKCSSLAVVNSKEKENRGGKKMKNSIPSDPIKTTDSTGKIKNVTDNVLTNDINSVQTNKKNTIKIASEQKTAPEVNTKNTKPIIPNSMPEPPSKRRIIESKLTSPTSKNLKQTKIPIVRLRKAMIDSEESAKSSNGMGEQKKSTVRLVTRSKTKEYQDDLNSPSTATENSKKSKKRLITQSKKDVNAADKIDDELSLTQSSQGSSKSRRPTRQSSKDLSLKKTQQRLSTRLKNGTSNNKFFKNKHTIAHSKISPYKKAVIGLERKNTRVRKARIVTVPRESSSFRLRQTTLKESFSNCAKKSLRPRATDKNYCEMSQIIEKHISPKKGPIYKTALNESPKKDKEKVYDFIVDNNGSNHKRKKKRVVRKAPIKKIKTVLTKNNIDAVSAVKSNNNIKAAKPIETALNNNKHSDNDKKVHSKEPFPRTSVTLSSNISTVMNNQTIEVVAEIYSPPTSNIEHGTTDIQSQEAVKLPGKVNPKIISDHKLLQGCRINITGTPLQPKSKEEEFSRPFRATNAFNMKPSMQVKTMMDHSLIRRSLSPISKANTPAYIEDIGSPWRPIIPSTFSRVKNVFQSTPQGEKFMSITAKTALGSNKQLFNAKMNKIVEQKNENDVSKNYESPVKGSNNILKSPIKRLNNNSKSPRKFGANISNINVIGENKNQRSPAKSPHKLGLKNSNTNKLNVPQLSPTKKKPHCQVETENSPSIIEISRRFSVPNNVPNINEIIEDKENSAPNEQSSRETTQAQSPSNRQQETVLLQSPVQNVEEFEPQPGPSGLQKSHSPIDTWNLKQTNLNKFFNLLDMPEKTRISTAQGIFDDAHSTPITGKGAKKLAAQLDVIDAFGFDESDNSFEEIDNISPIQRELVLPPPKVPIKKLKDSVKTNIPQVNKNCSANPMRISIGEIKKSLQNNANKNNGEKVEAEKQIHILNQMPHLSSKKDVVQAINFSDTFDVTNEEKNTQDIEETIKEVPLFVDLEPVHFYQPPRYSYKRKRHAQFNTENESEQEDKEINQKRPQKKKRIGKAEKEQNKKLNDWAKSVNQTFEEIDHFSLIVE